jgi:two-component system, OmpR family, response regulator
MKLLVVEDERVLSQQLADALADAGYAVDCAADGERADFLVRTESYDAVVLDLGLPRIDGLTVLRGWRQAGLSVPVLVLTARGSWHERASTRARTTTSRSRSASRKCSRGCAR